MKRKKKCLHCGFMKLSIAFEPDERMDDGLKVTCNGGESLSLKHWMRSNAGVER